MKRVICLVLASVAFGCLCHINAEDKVNCATNANIQINNERNNCIIDSSYKFENRLSKTNEYILQNGDIIKRVYFAYGDCVILGSGISKNKPIKNIICYDYSDNVILWTLDASIGYPRAINKDNVLMCGSKDIKCMDFHTGEKRWTYKNNDECNVIVSDEGVFLYYKGGVTCLDINTGDLVWQTAVDNYYYPYPYDSYFQSATPSIAISNNKIVYYYFGVTCLDIYDGEIIWQTAPYVNSDKTYSFLIGATGEDISIAGETIVAIRQLEFGYLGIDLNTGDILWESYTSSAPIAVSQYHEMIFTGFSCCTINDDRRVWYSDLSLTQLYYDISIYIINDNAISLLRNRNGISHKIMNRDIYTGRILHQLSFDDLVFFVVFSNGSMFFVSNGKLLEYGNAFNSLAYSINSNTYYPDNDKPKEMDSQPTIKNGRTLLPARYVVEPLGGQVFWDGEQRKVTCKLVAPDNAETDEYKENIVELWIDKLTARVNGIDVQIYPDNPDVVPTIINDRTMVPMRFLAESLGCEVEWVADTKEIILTYTP